MNPALDCILRPKSVAVIGASSSKGALGREIFDKLLKTGFNGPVYPVNPTAQYVHSVKAYSCLSDIPDKVDLAVIVIPKQFVLEVVKECAECGVKGVVVITAGFKETGEKGAAVEREIVDVIKKNNMRMVGPNCMGVINMTPDIRLDTSFAPTVPDSGNVAMASQSGALGQTILEHAHELNLGVSMFVSIGNKADVSGNDLLEYWGDDPSVDVILMYLESFGNPRRFIKLTKDISRKKPIIVVKSGRTASGAKAASSHTGALSGADVAYDTLFKQYGVIRADTINQMFDYALGFAHVPLPKGNRVAIITNAGGPGIMAADACDSAGLQVTQLSPTTKAKLIEKLVSEASLENPVDLLAGARPEDFQCALQAILCDENVDAVIVIFVAPIITDPQQVAAKISSVACQFDKPVLGCFMGVKGVATGVEELHRHGIPAYPFPELTVRTLAAMYAYSNWVKRRRGEVTHFKTEKKVVADIVATALHEKREHLNFQEVTKILKAYGIPFVQSVLCRTGDDIFKAAQLMKYPLVLKISSQLAVHKSEIGGVKVNLRTHDELSRAFKELITSLKTHNLPIDEAGFILQEMVTGGREIIMGLHAAPNFGAMIMFGLGGVYVEVLQDVVFRIAPISDREAEEMIREIKGLSILEGIRGEKPVDFHVLKTTLLRLSQLAVDFPEIKELDINPFMAFPESASCTGVDSRICVG